VSYDNLSLGFGGTSRFSGQRGRTADGTGRSGIRYPSPFFDIAQTYLPPSMKGLMRWCRYYYLLNPLINATIHKMSEYPITEIVVDERDAQLKEKWETLLDTHLRYRAFQIEVGLDYYTYGMCIVTLHFPFTKYLICPACKRKEKAAEMKYKWRSLDYLISCDKCSYEGPAKVQDYYEKDVRRIRLVRWNPEHIYVDPAFPGSDPAYTFELPQQVKTDLIVGRKRVLDTIPDVFVEAIRRNKNIRFSPENVFVFKRPIISQKDQGWGMPLILPVLKDSFYLQILRKAQEMIAQEHIVPLRILFPQAGAGAADPYTTIDLGTWRSRIESEIAKWKYDGNYLPILPLPIGNQTIGGDGKALGLYQEMQVWSEQIIAGMGVPREFIFGGMQYSGSNVSMRMLENMFLGYRIDHEAMLNNFVIRRISHFMGWKPIKAHMSRFKMADDLQRSAFYFQLNQAQKISDQTLLQECGMDPVVERERKKAELSQQLDYMRKTQTATASIQGEVMVIQAKAQTEAQKIQMAAMPQQPGVDPATGQPAQPGAEQGGQPGAQPGAEQQMPGAAQPGQTGQEGEMLPGQAAAPGMPEGSSVSMENAQQMPTEGIPEQMMSPLTQGMTGGGANLLYLAKRAARELEQMPDPQKYATLEQMKMQNPQLYSVVVQLLQSRQGSQADPLNPMQSPLPQQKPERKVAPVGA
jgi:hypothetical protein